MNPKPENPEEEVYRRRGNSVREYFALMPVFSYLFRVFGKQNSKNFNIKMMHGINRISILMFLFALLVWTVKRLFM
jgi:hypothetical protein